MNILKSSIIAVSILVSANATADTLLTGGITTGDSVDAGFNFSYEGAVEDVSSSLGVYTSFSYIRTDNVCAFAGGRVYCFGDAQGFATGLGVSIPVANVLKLRFGPVYNSVLLAGESDGDLDAELGVMFVGDKLAGGVSYNNGFETTNISIGFRF